MRADIRAEKHYMGRKGKRRHSMMGFYLKFCDLEVVQQQSAFRRKYTELLNLDLFPG